MLFMVQKIISKSEFADVCCVSATAISKAVKSRLKAALVGKRINQNHPSAVDYKREKLGEKTDSPAEGIDPLYEKAIAACRESGRWSTRGIQDALKIGFSRAKKIYGTMKAGNVIELDTEKPKTEKKPIEKKPQIKKIHIRGHAAKNETKKRAATDEDIFEVPDNIAAYADITLRQIIDQFGTDLRFVDFLRATKEIEIIGEKRLRNAETRGELVSRELVKKTILDPINSLHAKLLTDGTKTIARRVMAMSESGRDIKEIEEFVADQMTSFIKPVKHKIAKALKDEQ